MTISLASLYLQIVSLVRKECPQTPLVLYINGNGGLLERMIGTGVDVIGLDWTVDMADGRRRIKNNVGVQGNVDPAYLFSPLPVLTEEIHRSVAFVFAYLICSHQAGFSSCAVNILFTCLAVISSVIELTFIVNVAYILKQNIHDLVFLSELLKFENLLHFVLGQIWHG